MYVVLGQGIHSRLRLPSILCSIYVQSTLTSILFLHTDQETPKIYNIPTNITQATDSGLPTATVTWIEPVAIDNSGIQTLTSTQDSGSLFDIGVTLVTYTSVDAAGHKASMAFSVTVEGKEKVIQ